MKFVHESFINASAERVFAFHLLPDAIDRLMPPWEHAVVIERADISAPGSRAVIETRLFGMVTTRWIAEHRHFVPPHSFEDIQISGPFRSWLHRHIVTPSGNGALLRDDIEFEPPLWVLGRLAAAFLITPRLEKLFRYRHEVTREWCENPE